MKPHQLQRANSFVREELALLLSSTLDDPRISSLIVTDVDLSKDRRVARVYVSCYEESGDLEEGIRGLESAKDYIRRELGQILGWRFAPELVFRADRSLQRGARLDKVFKELEREQAQASNSDEAANDDQPTAAD